MVRFFVTGRRLNEFDFVWISQIITKTLFLTRLFNGQNDLFWTTGDNDYCHTKENQLLMLIANLLKGPNFNLYLNDFNPQF